jgi:hypothetical protein
MQSPRSENTVFCILLDNRELGISFASADEAEAAAHGLFQYGYKEIDIVDLFSHLVVRHVIHLRATPAIQALFPIPNAIAK